MRRFFSSLAFCLLSFAALSAAPRGVSYHVDRISVEGIGDSLLVTVGWTVPVGTIEDGKAVVFQMSLIRGDEVRKLRPVSVYGRKAFRNAYTSPASGSPEEVRISDLSKSTSFECESVFLYEPWMDTVKVVLNTYEWSKRGLTLLTSGQKGCYVKPSMPPAPVFDWDIVDVPKTSGEFVPVSFSAPVVFGERSTAFDPDLEDNRSEAEALVPLLRSVTSTKRFQPRNAKLVLYGYPMGSAKEYQRLCRARVQSLYAYLQRCGAFIVYPAAKETGGEDWQGVREWLEHSRYSSDARLFEIINGSASDDDKVLRIRAEKPAAWDDLERDCFPGLGRIVYEAEYRPLSFTSPREVRKVFDEIPQMLTPYDFWYLSSLYVKGSSEWNEVMVAGALLYPDCWELNCNAVYGLVSSGAARRATGFLRGVGDGAVGRYALAQWYYAMERYEECADILDELSRENMYYEAVYEKSIPFIDWTLNYVSWVEDDI